MTKEKIMDTVFGSRDPGKIRLPSGFAVQLPSRPRAALANLLMCTVLAEVPAFAYLPQAIFTYAVVSVGYIGICFLWGGHWGLGAPPQRPRLHQVPWQPIVLSALLAAYVGFVHWDAGQPLPGDEMKRTILWLSAAGALAALSGWDSYRPFLPKTGRGPTPDDPHGGSGEIPG